MRTIRGIAYSSRDKIKLDMRGTGDDTGWSEWTKRNKRSSVAVLIEEVVRTALDEAAEQRGPVKTDGQGFIIHHGLYPWWRGVEYTVHISPRFERGTYGVEVREVTAD